MVILGVIGTVGVVGNRMPEKAIPTATVPFRIHRMATKPCHKRLTLEMIRSLVPHQLPHRAGEIHGLKR